MSADPGQAADLFADPPAALLRTETFTEMFTAEAFGGYLTGTAREHVYNVPGDGTKLSQLNWSINHAFVMGGRATVRPLDWLSIRLRGWTSVDGGGKLDDYDWLAGYRGPDSWSHWSTHPDTRLKQAWQGDLSVAAWFWRQGGLSVSAGGLPHVHDQVGGARRVLHLLGSGLARCDRHVPEHARHRLSAGVADALPRPWVELCVRRRGDFR